MEKRNLLLGRGEKLTSDIEPVRTSNNKAYPYTWSEARERLLPRLQNAIDEIDKVSSHALPSGLSVLSMTLHPAFLAKSYFPSKMLQTFDLRCVGSKQVSITPEKSTKKSAPLKEVTSDLYIAGTSNAFRCMFDSIVSEELANTVKKEISELEDLCICGVERKIRDISSNATTLEVALHTSVAEDIFSQFEAYVEQIGGSVDSERQITSGGLTFVPINLDPGRLDELASFSMLRIVRSMPHLRIGDPEVLRIVDDVGISELPAEKDVADDSVRAAIFDGGVGHDFLGDWVREIDISADAPITRGLAHGSRVTSAYLFGSLKTGADIPLPYTRVDHYRVLGSNSDMSDPHLYDVLNKIVPVLENGDYQLVNLSLGPDLPVEDDDVSAWTTKIDEILSNGRTFMTVAAGNSGELPGIDGRIQPPSDAVNALSVGAANTEGDNWSRAEYSSKGPGRSPGFVKPDGVSFGGSDEEPFVVYNPFSSSGIDGVKGTSFASPNILRVGAGLLTQMDYDISPMGLRALVIHHADDGGVSREEVGWGRFPFTPDEILYTDDDTATVIYQGELSVSQWIRATIPLPSIQINGMVTIKATFCYSSTFTPEHPVNYTRSGLQVIFRPKQDTTKTFFSRTTQYETEQEARNDAHRWETVMKYQRRMQHGSLDQPCFDIVYRARDGGDSLTGEELDALGVEKLNYCLVVTVKANNTPELYNAVRQQYRILEPIRIRDRIRLRES